MNIVHMNAVTPPVEVHASSPRHLALIKINGALLVEILRTSGPRCIACDGLPADAVLVRMGYDNAMDSVYAVFEHPSFPEHEEGALVQELRPQYTGFYGEAAIAALRGERVSA